MTGCPQDPSSCQCPEHCDGLSIYAEDPIAYELALARCRPDQVRMSVVTLGPSAEPTPCTNTMLCECKDCRTATAFLAKRGGQGAGNASPFKVRRAA
jgi:hypothetical protein